MVTMVRLIVPPPGRRESLVDVLPSLSEKQVDAGRIFFADVGEEHKGGVLSDH